MTDSEGSDQPRSGERIAKLLARAGIASRREVERMIADGRVKLDGTVITTPATVLPGLGGVTVDDRPVRAAEPPRLFLFHKPSGLITAERDPAGRPTIYTALRNALPAGTPRVMPVGRLDLNTEGLLLLTNDGELKRALELPATGIPRTYRARTFGDISQARLEELIEGVEIDGVRYGRIDANMERRTGRNQWVELTLAEGKNREVRRVLEHLGLQVSRLLRVAYGPFLLTDLPRGSAWEVPQVLVERFRKGLETGKRDLAPVFAPPARPAAPLRPRQEDRPAAAPPARRTARPGPAPAAPATGAKAPRADKAADQSRRTRPLPDKPGDRAKPAERRPARARSGRDDGVLMTRSERRDPEARGGRGTRDAKDTKVSGRTRPVPASEAPQGAKAAPARERNPSRKGWAKAAKPSSGGARRSSPRKPAKPRPDGSGR